MDIYRQRVWLAFGGWNSVFFGGVFGYLGYMMSGLGASALVPVKETLTTRAGFGSYLRNAGLKVLIPAILGMGS